MLEAIDITNFRPIKQLRLDLRYLRRAPAGYSDQERLAFIPPSAPRDQRLVPVMALYGANASGKTSVLQAVLNLQQLLRNGFRQGSYQPNRIIENLIRAESGIHLTFWKNGVRFSYEVHLTSQGFAQETLHCDDELIFRVADQRREWGAALSTMPEEMLTQAFERHCVDAATGIQRRSFLKEISENLPGFNKRLNQAAEAVLKDFVYAEGDVPYWAGVEILASTFSGEDKLQSALNLLAKYLKKLDFRIDGLQFRKQRVQDIIDAAPAVLKQSLAQADPDGVVYSMNTIHKAQNGSPVVFNLEEESNGTKRLVGMLGFLLAALRMGKTVLIDEIDQSLHPLLVIELARLFKTKRLNPLGAQLIFTLHNTELPASGLITPEELTVVKQLGFQGTSLQRLSDIPGMKDTSSFRHRYLNGDFGGIPAAGV